MSSLLEVLGFVAVAVGVYELAGLAVALILLGVVLLFVAQGLGRGDGI